MVQNAMNLTSSTEKRMPLKAMVFTSDQNLAATFAASVVEIPLDWIWLEEVSLAKNILNRERFDFLLTDCTCQAGRSLIKVIRRSQINNNCTIFGMARNTDEPGLLQLGADMYLRRRLQSRLLADRIREALPLTKNHLRKSQRYPVNIPISLRLGSETLPATGLNLSMGGMMLKFEREVSRYEVLAVQFVLPDTAKKVRLHARVVWHAPNSSAGIRFLGITDELRADLAQWAQRQSSSSAV
jgi:DNA-binding response OmpR family regulator